MAIRLYNSWSVYAVVLIIHAVGLLIFLRGFFPSKVVLPGFSEFESTSPFLEHGDAQFDKFVLMVVDAMRSDFMYSESRSNMPFLHHLILTDNAVPFTAFSNPPTVTLPRLKGITTGGAPSFLDAILNVADDNDQSQGLTNQDSWISQFSQNKTRRIDFFGDDTWLKLFPPEDFFEKFDGTNSFFVSDFTEVDNNVTRHLESELNSPDWDGLILHYLGLDHIGHKGGPDSVFMNPKQKEMDDVIERLYKYTSKSNTLLVVMGDHGMNEIGNHGGSSKGETSSGLVFISPKFQKLNKGLRAPVESSEDYLYFRPVNQIDIVPTLAAMLNFPIPKNNLGIFLDEFLDLWLSPYSKVNILRQNCAQFVNLLKVNFGTNNEVLRKWSHLSGENDKALYYEFLSEAQSLLTSTATNYDYRDIFTGFSLVFLSSLVALGLFCYYFFWVSKCSYEIVVFSLASFVLYAVHFHGSSLIEEEHQIWWFFAIVGLIHFSFFLKLKSKRHIFLILACFRLIRAWCNGGQKYTSLFTISSYLLSHPSLLWTLNIFTYFLYATLIYGQGGIVNCLGYADSVSFDFKDTGNLFGFILAFVVSSIAFLFKLSQYYNDGNDIPKGLNWLFLWISDSFGVTDGINDKNEIQEMNILLSQLIYICIVFLLGLRIVLGAIRKVRHGFFTDVTNICTLLLIHLTKPEVIPMYAIFFVIKYSFSKILVENSKLIINNVDNLIIVVSQFILVIQNLAFFSSGNTNLLATVDLSNSYNGVRSYNLVIVGSLTFLSTFAAPLYWSLSSLQLLFETQVVGLDLKQTSNPIYLLRLRKSIMLVKSLISLTFYSIAATSLVASCINLRFHLFIWTVFSPKLLYFASWSVLLNMLFDTLIVALSFLG
ncbi:uncharacterized protein PRCAT00003439001 [Priceomyces carsonii]|uniref:uncharacterized protein n=1 Tax=Priceomyces carsonii TaxID=28549 RepID=UPI002ED78011|nr:unnamed protein product [Priceomyces carsonii]